MRRRFLKPFINLSDDFLFPSLFNFSQPLKLHFRTPRYHFEKIESKKHKVDPEQVFNNFFNENQIKENQEKEFFKKHYPEKVQDKIDPFKVLQISKDASEDQIKQAYRKLAIKYHPKNNSSPEAKIKFSQIARAYEQAMYAKNQTKYSDLGIQSFFDDFQKKLDQMVSVNLDEPMKNLQSNKEVKQGEQISSAQKGKQDNLGQLYSESSFVENVNGKQTRFVIEKKYKKDDKTLSVKREQTLKEDGDTEILETIDDGKQVKKKHYMLDKNTKETKQLK